jgi:hypothetical protein
MKTCLSALEDRFVRPHVVHVHVSRQAVFAADTLYISRSYLHSLNRGEDGSGRDASYLCVTDIRDG